jgi:hypothetical protein
MVGPDLNQPMNPTEYLTRAGLGSARLATVDNPAKTASPFVFTSERGSPFTPDGFAKTVARAEFCRFRDICYINATLGKFSHSVMLRNRLRSPMSRSAGFGV